MTLVPIDHTNVTVNGSKWRATAPWDGLDFKRAKLLPKSNLMVWLMGREEAPADQHLLVPWCHPNDQPGGWSDGAMYRVRPAKKSMSFEKKRGKWLVRL